MQPNDSPRTIGAGVRIGHVHLNVANLDRALAFYRDALGFVVTQRYGNQAVLLSAGGYHHHFGGPACSVVRSFTGRLARRSLCEKGVQLRAEAPAAAGRLSHGVRNDRTLLG